LVSFRVAYFRSTNRPRRGPLHFVRHTSSHLVLYGCKYPNFLRQCHTMDGSMQRIPNGSECQSPAGRRGVAIARGRGCARPRPFLNTVFPLALKGRSKWRTGDGESSLGSSGT
jgi:hypothetical protein